MQYSKLGKSDLKISKIGFGCMSLCGNARENELIIEKAAQEMDLLLRVSPSQYYTAHR